MARELEDPYLHPPNELPIVALHTSYNSRLLASWEALDLMYNPINNELQEMNPRPLAPGENGVRVPASRPGADCGMHGVEATNADALLYKWERRGDGVQASQSATDLALVSVDEDGELVPPAVNAPARAKRVRERLMRSAAHVRSSAHAQRVSLQLTSVS